MTDPVPSKELCKHDWVGDDHCAYCENERLQSLLSAAYQLAGLVGAPVRFLDAFSRHEGDGDDLLPVTLEECDEIERLRTTLRGIQSCSSCEACRGAATLALNGAQADPLSIHAEKWVTRAQKLQEQVARLKQYICVTALAGYRCAPCAERLAPKQAHEREMPHCSTCSCPPYPAPEPAPEQPHCRLCGGDHWVGAHDRAAQPPRDG